MAFKGMLYCNKERHRHPSTRPTRIHAGVMLALLFGSDAMTVGTATAANGVNGEWTVAGGAPEGTRYSDLADITPANVSQLKEEFSLKTGVKGSHMGEPLVVKNVVNGVTQTMLYVVTPYPNKLIAYDLSKGEAKWTYAPDVNEYAKGVNCCDSINRGAAYADGKIVFTLLDNTVVAVDKDTGKEVWRNHLADPRTGITMTAAPIITPGKADGIKKVIVASSSGEMGIRGWIQALDLNTGKSLWRAYSTGPDTDVLSLPPSKGGKFQPFYAKDQGENVGTTSWPGESWKVGGSAAWAYMTYDPELDLLFYGTSQPGVWGAEMRCDKAAYEKNPRVCDNKWGASIFARKPDTGQAIWAYQFTPNDGWDFDSISESIPVNQTVNGQPRQLLVHLDKNGFGYTFDRGSGEILNANKFLPDDPIKKLDDQRVNWASNIDLTTGLPEVNPNKITHIGEWVDDICPSALGGKGWEPGAFSPKTGLFYMPTFNKCMSMHMLKAEYVAGAPYMGNDLKFLPGNIKTSDGKPFTSELIAWDATKGQRAWTIPEANAIYGGVLATAGGVVFYGTQDKTFKAVDASTGDVVFKTQMECSTVGNPISFTGSDGKQRIAVFSGVGALAGGIGGGGVCGDSGQVHVYKLP